MMEAASLTGIRDLLEEAFQEYNRPGFIADDPVSIPHRFVEKEDIEIAGLLAATLAWGNRKTILRSASTLIRWMDNDPSGFVRNFRDKDLKPFARFVHRTFNGDDCIGFLNGLQAIYLHHGGLEAVFSYPPGNPAVRDGIMHFREVLFSLPHMARTEKHVANPARNAAAKRINMFLRWMVRSDEGGIDFGLWKKIRPSSLMCPLDVHTGRVSRKLGLLGRKQDDWKAVEELTAALRELHPRDPVRYDIALFGLGMSGRY